MNIKSNNRKKLKSSLFSSPTEEELLHQEEYGLMANYLSEIERIYALSGMKLKRNELAIAIKTTPSYITQVFTGNKPLNFKTIVKIQRFLGVRFKVTACEMSKLAKLPHVDYRKVLLINEQPRIQEASYLKVAHKTKVLGSVPTTEFQQKTENWQIINSGDGAAKAV